MPNEPIKILNTKDVISLLSVAKEAAGAVLIIGPILQGSVGALVEVVKIMEKIKSNKEKRKTLLQRIHTITQILAPYISPENSRPLRPGPLLDRLEKLSRDITTLKPHLEKLQSYHRPKLWFSSGAIAGYLDDIDGIIEGAIKTFQLEGGIRQEALLDKATDRLKEINDGVNNLQVTSGSSRRITPADFLDMTAPKCLKNTRVDLLNELRDWAHAPSLAERKIVWMHGPPGSGKSTIARTIASELRNEKLLAASFFFSRTIADRRDPYNVFPSIAHQLSIFNREFSDNSGVQRLGETLDTQLRRLILTPLSRVISFERPWIIILDALDECEDEEGATEILTLLGRYLHKLPHVRFLITSRPEYGIRLRFQANDDASLEPLSQAINLYEIDISIVSGDIHRYLEYELGTWARRERLHLNIQDLRLLTDAAAGLFIYAATCIRLIKSAKEPSKVLRWLIQSRLDGNSSSLDGLDSLYLQIMENALREKSGQNSENLRHVIGAIVHLRNPLSCHDLSGLLGMKDEEVVAALLPLSSVILVPDLNTSSEVTFYHQSFRDFLVEPPKDSPADKRNIIHHTLSLHDKPSHDTYLAENCFKTFNEVLHHNMSGVEDLTKLNSEIPDLASRLKEILPPHARYACRYWSSHVYGSYAVRSTTVCKQLELWTRRDMLSWLESLSLCKDLDHAVFSLSEAERWYQECPSPQDDVVQLLKDGQRFIQMFFEPIEHGAGHIYCSALPFTPDSELRSRYLSFAKVKVVRGRNTKWPPLLLSIHAHSGWVYSVAFSPDGRRVVSGSIDKTVRIWSSETGKLLSTLEGHTGSVFSVAFSPDGKRVVSGSNDSTVRIWSLETGKLLSTLEGHMSSVISVAFSPDGRRVVSGSIDKTVRIWSSETGKLLSTLEGHTGSVFSVAFSPDGRRVVSGSDDSKCRRLSMLPACSGEWSLMGVAYLTVRIWSSETGKVLSTLEGHMSSVISVVFSPDGKQIVSGSDDSTVRIWSSETGKLLSTLKGHVSLVRSVAFSPDGKQVVSGSGDKTVRIWSLETGKLLSTLKEHMSSVYSVAFSPDGRRVVSGSVDSMVRIWSSEMGKVLKGHTDEINSVAFSPDSRRVVSGSDDETVRIWSLETGKLLSTLEGHTGSVFSVAFSPDGRRVVSGSYDKTVRIWSSETGKVLSTLEGHMSSVISVAFSPDGKQIVSGSDDSTVRIWSSETGKLLSTLKGHVSLVRSVAFSPDGKQVVSGSGDSTVRIWSLETGKLLSTLTGDTRAFKSLVLSLDGNHNVGEDELAPSLHIYDSGWVCDQTRSLCWVPPTLRPSELIAPVVHRNAMCFINEKDIITILNFSLLLPNS